MKGGFTHHGGRLAAARAAFGPGEAPWIDLSTGINPACWPGAHTIPVDWQLLPDPVKLARLEAAAAEYFGVDPAHCCALPGSEIGLRLLAPILGLPAHHFVPTYRTHAEAFPQARPIAGIEELPRSPSVLLVANPNNPDGRLIPPPQLLEWLGRLAANGGWLVVDEAFADTLPACSVASEVTDDRRLIVLRSFGKFFGLPGVRLGFAIGPRPVITAYRQLLGEWPVSSAAIIFGEPAYRDDAWIAAMRRELVGRAQRLDRLLARHGFTPTGECPLFRLIETPDAQALFERLARQAILTRPFAENPRWLRFGLPANEAEMARLDEALGDG